MWTSSQFTELCSATVSILCRLCQQLLFAIKYGSFQAFVNKDSSVITIVWWKWTVDPDNMVFPQVQSNFIHHQSSLVTLSVKQLFVHVWSGMAGFKGSEVDTINADYEGGAPFIRLEPNHLL